MEEKQISSAWRDHIRSIHALKIQLIQMLSRLWEEKKDPGIMGMFC